MSINRFLVCTVLGIAGSAVGTTQAKVLAFHVADPIEAQTLNKAEPHGDWNGGDICLYALNKEFRRVGITTQTGPEGADAEMIVVLDFVEEEPWPMGDQKRILYKVAVKSVPAQSLIYADQGEVENKDPVKGCAKIAQMLIKNFLAAGEWK